MVIDTGVSRDLADSATMNGAGNGEEASGLLRDIILQHEPANETARSISTLPRCHARAVSRYGAELSELLRRRAGYVIAEDARVLQTVNLFGNERV